MRRSNFGDTRVNVIIPTLNEGKNISDILIRLRLIGCKDILVVDGHSQDDTVETARMLGAKVIHQNGNGKGAALRQAFEDSCLDGDVVVIMDADGSMNPEEIQQFVEALADGANVVKGSRFLPHGGSEDLTPIRRAGNVILTKLLNFLFLTKYTDLCYGFIAFDKRTIKKLNGNLASENFEIETEICIKSKIMGLKVLEIPSVERARRYGVSNLRTFKDGFKIMGLLLREALRLN
jgi:glycosyltransferase involved in cell wall biosynthesis